MHAYYYRAGRRVPVLCSTSAFVVPRPLDALGAIESRWFALPLARRHAVLVRRSLVGSLVERAAIVAQIADDALGPDRGSSPVDLPAADAAPVLLSGDGRMLLLPTGAVVAHFPDESAEAVAAAAAESGWQIERPIRFLDRGYVLRRAAARALDPLALANALVEIHSARFAHPIFLEEIVPAALAAPAARSPNLRPAFAGRG